MNKKLMLTALATCACALQSSVNAEPAKVVLTSRFLKIIDGAFITGEIVGVTLQVRKNLLEMLYGKRRSDGMHEGAYEFKGAKQTINTLAQFERDLVKNQENLDVKLKSANDDEKESISSELDIVEQQLNRVHDILLTAKQDFQNAVSVFISHARTAKEPVIMLITEYCEKSNRTDSLLLDWAKIEDSETESFNKQVTSFTIFETFLNDLANFLEAMIRGCPKAQQQFKKLLIERSRA